MRVRPDGLDDSRRPRIRAMPGLALASVVAMTRAGDARAQDVPRDARQVFPPAAPLYLELPSPRVVTIADALTVRRARCDASCTFHVAPGTYALVAESADEPRTVASVVVPSEGLAGRLRLGTSRTPGTVLAVTGVALFVTGIALEVGAAFCARSFETAGGCAVAGFWTLALGGLATVAVGSALMGMAGPTLGASYGSLEPLRPLRHGGERAAIPLGVTLAFDRGTAIAVGAIAFHGP